MNTMRVILKMARERVRDSIDMQMVTNIEVNGKMMKSTVVNINI
jgi:hypothetical protein